MRGDPCTPGYWVPNGYSFLHTGWLQNFPLFVLNTPYSNFRIAHLKPIFINHHPIKLKEKSEQFVQWLSWHIEHLGFTLFKTSRLLKRETGELPPATQGSALQPLAWPTEVYPSEHPPPNTSFPRTQPGTALFTFSLNCFRSSSAM